jgi:hypothetical protein
MELSAMAADAERFDAKTTVLIENVTHHIEEEEQDWFPKVRAGLGRNQLRDIGTKLEQARKKAPRTPARPRSCEMRVSALKTPSGEVESGPRAGGNLTVDRRPAGPPASVARR